MDLKPRFLISLYILEYVIQNYGAMPRKNSGWHLEGVDLSEWEANTDLVFMDVPAELWMLDTNRWMLILSLRE